MEAEVQLHGLCRESLRQPLSQEALRDGPVHFIKNNRPSYVVLSEAAYEELLESSRHAAMASLRESLQDLEAGRTNRYENADALMQALDDDES